MPITLTLDVETITLPDGLIWTDEFAWSSISQSTDIALSGALLIQEGQQLAGRPITLGGDWAPRSTVLALRAWAEGLDVQMTLDLRGTEYLVRWRRPALQATPVIVYAEPDPGDWYELTVNLIEADT